jgi:hypothetical protein
MPKKPPKPQTWSQRSRSAPSDITQGAQRRQAQITGRRAYVAKDPAGTTLKPGDIVRPSNQPGRRSSVTHGPAPKKRK